MVVDPHPYEKPRVKAHEGIACLIVSLGMLLVRSARGDAFQDSYDRAIAAYQGHHFEEALALFEEANHITPKLRLLVNQGQTLLELGRAAEALQRCEAYLQKASRDSPYQREAEACVRRAKEALADADRRLKETPPDAAHRAELAFMQQSYGEARRAWHLAYEERPQAMYLYRCGEASQLLLEWQQAINDFQAYLSVAGEGLPPERTAELRRRIASLQQVLDREEQAQQRPQQLPSRAVARERPGHPTEVRRNEGVLAAGLTLWLSAYLPALGLGAWYGATASSRPEIYYVLAAPLAGPFIGAALFAVNSRGDQQAALRWSLPWALADGGAQIAGLIMTIVGSRRRPVPVLWSEALRLAPLATPLGVGLSALGSF